MKLADHTSSKVTHAGRRSGAQHAQSNGAPIEEIAQHGNWNHRRLVAHYLSPVPKDVPYRMAGFRDKEDIWLERNTFIPPLALQRKIFPFVEKLFPESTDWGRWMDNLMLDQPEETNRPKTSWRIIQTRWSLQCAS
jgi:hypothetical protein